MKANQLLSCLITFLIVSCATSNTSSQSINPYISGYNEAAKSCNDLVYYSKKYNKSTSPTSPAGSLWGLITTADIGYANAVAKLAAQKDVINNVPALSKRDLYSTTPVLDKCNFNPNYGQYCNTAYTTYLSEYKAESINLNNNDKNSYVSGFNDGANECNRKFIAPPPLTPIQLK